MSSCVGVCIFYSLSGAEDVFVQSTGEDEGSSSTGVSPVLVCLDLFKLCVCSAGCEKAPSTGFVSNCWPPQHLLSDSSTLSLCGFSSPWVWWDIPVPPSLHYYAAPQRMWVGTGLGNWSLWALGAHPAVGWTEAALRRQLLGRPMQAEREGERWRNPVAANR